MVGSSFFDMSEVLGVTVVFLGIAYAMTALAALRLVSRENAPRLEVPGLRVLLVFGALAGAYLAAQASPELMAAAAALLAGGTALFRAMRMRGGGR